MLHSKLKESTFKVQTVFIWDFFIFEYKKFTCSSTSLGFRTEPGKIRTVTSTFSSDPVEAKHLMKVFNVVYVC